MRFINIKILGILLIHFAFLSCSGDDSSSSLTTEATYSSLFTNVFSSQTCKNCHIPGAEAGGPDFTDKAALYTSLTQKMNTLNWDNLPVGCEDLFLVVAGEATKSILAGSVVSLTDYQFSNGSCTPGISNHTEVHKATLTGETAKSLIKWINEGAANN